VMARRWARDWASSAVLSSLMLGVGAVWVVLSMVKGMG